MTFTETPLGGAFIVRAEPIHDERGFFARTWCRREFEAQGLARCWAQCNVSCSPKAGTLRGMHFQAAPHAEAKLIRCIRGTIHDVIIDLRPESPTFKGHYAIVLASDRPDMLYVPEGFAHGFLTLEDRSEVFYHMSDFYEPSLARGVRWNDPSFGIHWPGDVCLISEKDRSYPDFAL